MEKDSSFVGYRFFSGDGGRFKDALCPACRHMLCAPRGARETSLCQEAVNHVCMNAHATQTCLNTHTHSYKHMHAPHLQSLGHTGVPDDQKLNLGKLVLDGTWPRPFFICRIGLPAFIGMLRIEPRARVPRT
eukprot:1138434-Pelagomonas_calceolata.AAC.3